MKSIMNPYMNAMSHATVLGALLASSCFGAMEEPLDAGNSVSAPAPVAVAPASVGEITLAFNTFDPKDSETYDIGGGIEIQLRSWACENAGVALVAGASSWDIVPEQIVERELGLNFVGTLDGYVDMIPFGSSILIRLIPSERTSLTLEAGFRYVYVDSQVEVDYSISSSRGTLLSRKEKVEIDAGMIGVVSANVDLSLTPRVALFAGFGYQFDLIKGDVRLMGESIGDNELASQIIQLGMSVRF